MKLVSWNCSGLGSKEEIESLRNLIKSKRPQILLLQETKMKDQAILQECKHIWKNSMGLSIISWGASGGIYTLWKPHQFQLVASKDSLHSMLLKLLHLSSRKNFIIVNVYMPNQYQEKIICWRSLLEMMESKSIDNLIIVGEFNTTLHHWENREG